MKRDFVASSFHSLQPRLAQGINRAIDLRLISGWGVLVTEAVLTPPINIL
jgi:hypothetical protein